MNLFSKLVVTAVTSALLLIGGIFAGEKLNQPTASTQSFGSFSPVQGQTYTLQGAGITATQNTIPLSSFTTPDGRAITMTMFGGTIGYGTLEPNTNSKIEDITFSGVTQNANGSAILTGVTRGNDFVTPYNASTTLSKAHAGGSYFILSNTAGFYGQQFLFANSSASSTATITFSNTNPPFYYPGPGVQGQGSAISTTSEFASIAYVNAVSTAGAPNASTGAKGIIQLSTATQAAAGTATGSTGAALVPPNSLFNATQSTATIIPVTNTSGKLSQLFLDLTQAFSPSGTWNFLSNVGIGTSSPYAALSVAGFTGVVANIFTATSTTATSSFAGNLTVSKNASTTNLVISGTCSKGNGQGCNQVTSTSSISTALTSGNSARTTVSAICVSPQLVVGGGGFVVSGTPVTYIDTSYPSAAGTWTVVYQNGTTGFGGGGNVQAYAICINP